MMRSSVVLPEPDGPSSATSSPGAIDRSTLLRIGCAPKLLVTPTMSIPWAIPWAIPCPRNSAPPGSPSGASEARDGVSGDRPAPFEIRLEAERGQSEESEERSEGESGGDVVFIVKDLHLQRDGVGEAADVP